MKVRNLKHRRVVTPWWRAKSDRLHRRLVMGPLSYRYSRSVALK